MRVCSDCKCVKRYEGRKNLHGGLLKMGANWVSIDYQLATNCHPIDHHSRLSGSNRGEGLSNLSSTAV